MLSFANATGNLFNRLGKLGALIANSDSYQATQVTAMVSPSTGVVAQLDAEADIQAIMGSSYIGVANSIGGNFGGVCQQIANAIVNRMVFRDNPQYGQTLQGGNIITSMQEVIRQMRIAGATVQSITVTATPGAFVGVGDGVINASVIRDYDGVTQENAFTENLLFTCIGDSYNGGRVSAGNETFLVTGAGAQGNMFAFNWPLGSNASIQLSAINAGEDNSQGNLLTNSGFDAFTANVPDNWDLVTGTGGTNVFEETTIVYTSPPTKSLMITGDGPGTLVCLKQQFDTSTGTQGELTPQTQYSFNIFVRRDGVAPGAGVLTVDLVDENDTVIQDAAGVNNSFDIDLTLLSTVFTSYTGVFRTPVIMPNEQYLRIRLTTALTNGRSVYLDFASLGEMLQVYTSGPFVAVHAGSIPFLRTDYGNCQITNGRGPGGTYSTWQTLMARLFPIMMSYGILLPSSSTPTISDSLIA